MSNKYSIFFNIYVWLMLALFSGCASLPRAGNDARFNANEYVTINAFCQKNNARFSYDTIDDIIKINLDGKDARLLVNSKVAYLGGNIFYLRAAPKFVNGTLYVPKNALTFLGSKRVFMPQPTFRLKTVVIDPGHGGKDAGAIALSGLTEKAVNLRIAKYLKSELRRMGFTVFLTRETDLYLTLKERTEFARRKNADLFISVHANANKKRSIKGAEVYYLKLAKFGGTTRALRLAKGTSFGGKAYSVKSILWDMLLAKDYFLSVEAAHIFYNSFYNLGFKVRHPRSANFYVLRNAYVPAILVETGYLSNSHEAALLKKTYYQKQLAEAIALGVSALSKRYNK